MKRGHLAAYLAGAASEQQAQGADEEGDKSHDGLVKFNSAHVDAQALGSHRLWFTAYGLSTLASADPWAESKQDWLAIKRTIVRRLPW